MKMRHHLITIGTMALLTLGVGFGATQPVAATGGDHDGPECLPGIEVAVRRNPVYQHLFGVLSAYQGQLKTLLQGVTGQTSYAALLTRARFVATKVEGGRVVVTLADGTVVVDTAGADDPSNTLPSGNSFDHFNHKTVNENHNSRVAIFAAQLYPCGIGLERKLSTTTGETESYLALRLGQHLDSIGTARLSTKQPN